MTASDAPAILARARQGDSEAFRALVAQHSRSAFRLAFRMTGNEQDAEDVVQESLLKAYRHLGRFETRADFGTWLYRIVANCALDAIRSRQSRQQHTAPDPVDASATRLAADQPGPERLAESSEVQRRVEAALQKLSPLERAAFALRHYEGRTIHEIGRTLGLGTSASKQAIFRAVRKVRVDLEGLRPRIQDPGAAICRTTPKKN